jgi:putative transposase
MKAYYHDIGLGVLCGLFGKSRQAYYARSYREERQRFEDAIVVDLVREERKIARRVGGKKLYLILKASVIGSRHIDRPGSIFGGITDA